MPASHSPVRRAARRAPRLARIVKSHALTLRNGVDLGRDPSRAVIVLGSARSGTTKLAEMLASGPRTRFICEPLNTFQSPFAKTFAWGSYRDPRDPDPELEELWTRALDGRLRSEWTDARNAARLSNRRVVKCIAGTNLAQWMRRCFPVTPIVYLVRNPLATAKSIEALYQREVAARRVGPWTELQGSNVEDVVVRAGLLDGPLQHVAPAIIDAWQMIDTPFERCVLRWCLENHLALAEPPMSGFHLVRYEELLTNPRAHVAELAAFTRLDLSRALDDLALPSSTDFSHHADDAPAVMDRRDNWQGNVSSAEEAAARRILQLFGLEHYALTVAEIG